ncbi:Endoglucanase [Alteromonadaceae bacterium Bs31]|nr:Endoglucanase [Alteromonadaceae bacterium Bs31]
MKKPTLFSLLFYVLLSACISPSNSGLPHPVDLHGQLSIRGNQLVNAKGEAVALSGPSFFWSNTGWGGNAFYHPKAVKYFKNEWNANIIRVAIGVEPSGGYIEEPDENYKRALTLINAGLKQGLYVIVDWHSHHAQDYPEEAKAFFSKIAARYGDKPNIIYEIYNEPLRDTDWQKTIKPYAIELIQTIRKIDPDNIIIVGTQSWSQDVDKAAANPIEGFDNIAYALHFYAGTHKEKLRKKARTALQSGLALVVTEWGTVNADGDGPVDYQSVDEWMSFLSEHKISHCNWSANNKNESSSMFTPETRPKGKWADDNLSESGKLAKKIISEWNKQ